MAAERHVVGVMGYAGRWRGIDGDPAECRETDARAMLRRELEQRRARHGDRLCMVSGATKAGVLDLAYDECRALGIEAAGVTAEQVLAHTIAPLRWIVPAGRRFGDESTLFVETANEFIMLGGGPQSRDESRMAAALGKAVVVVRGFGGAADAITCDEVPTATFVERRSLHAAEAAAGVTSTVDE